MSSQVYVKSYVTYVIHVIHNIILVTYVMLVIYEKYVISYVTYVIHVINNNIFNKIFVSSHMYPENPKWTRVIVGSMNMRYDIYPTLPEI